MVNYLRLRPGCRLFARAIRWLGRRDAAKWQQCRPNKPGKSKLKTRSFHTLATEQPRKSNTRYL
jgi:hypothetical protein